MNCPTTFGPVKKRVAPTHKPGRDDTTAKHYRTNCFNGENDACKADILCRTKVHKSQNGFRRSRNTQVWNFETCIVENGTPQWSRVSHYFIIFIDDK